MRNEDILKEVDRRFSDQKDLLDAKFTHLSAVIQAGFEMASGERTTIIEHQKQTNGRVTTLEDKTECYDEHIDTSEKVKKHYRWIIIGFFFLVFASSLLSHFIIERVDLRQTIERTLDNRGVVTK